MSDTITLPLAFALVALASHRIGRWFTRLGLPYITGYLATGALAGTFALDLIPSSAANDLRYVDEISLGVIAFVAGSELYLPDLRGRLRTIGWLTGGIAAVTGVALAIGIYVATGMLSFTADLDGTGRIAVAILGAAVLLALSPPSTIAVIKEVGARGPFTSTVLSTTIVMDVVVVVAFAAASSVAAALLQDAGLDLGFVAVLALDLALALGGGYVLGRALGWVFGRRLPALALAAVVLGAGYGVYELAEFIDAWSLENLPFEVYIEPLLLTMIAGFTVTNFTDRRVAFEETLHEISPAVYVAFFTLTGLALKLDLLVTVLPTALAIFVLRAGAIAIGARAGATIAGQAGPLRSSSWMALITQAGIALGLAREAGVQFPSLGVAFTTLIVAVVVLNEVLGPVLLKYVLGRVQETAASNPDRTAWIYGIDRNSLRLAERLNADGWRTVLADHDPEHVEVATNAGVEAALVRVGSELLDRFEERPDTVVAVSDDDAANLDICRAAADAGVGRTVARATDPAILDALHEVGTLVIDPTSAAVALLEEAVRTPDATSLVLHADAHRDTRQVTVTARNLHGRQLRDLRFPQEVLVLSVRRKGAAIIPDGFTRLEVGDDLTLIGEPGALYEAAAAVSG